MSEQKKLSPIDDAAGVLGPVVNDHQGLEHFDLISCGDVRQSPFKAQGTN